MWQACDLSAGTSMTTPKSRGYFQGYHFTSKVEKLSDVTHYAVIENQTHSYPDSYGDYSSETSARQQP